MATVELTEANFNQIVSESPMILIDFWAAWCGPCVRFGPIYDKASDKYDDIVFGKVDTDAQQRLAATFNIRSIPTLMVIRDGVVLYSEPGAISGSALTDLIEQARQLDMDAVHAEIAAGNASTSA